MKSFFKFVCCYHTKRKSKSEQYLLKADNNTNTRKCEKEQVQIVPDKESEAERQTNRSTIRRKGNTEGTMKEDVDKLNTILLLKVLEEYHVL